MKERRFYVYEHWRPDIGVCFYVGKGHGRRANVLYKRNYHHTAIQRKLNGMGLCVEIKIIARGMSEVEALAFEVGRIAFWVSQGNDLANKTSGGESPVICAESIEKMRNAKLGRKLTAEHKGNIGSASKKAWESEEYRAKFSASHAITNALPETKERRSKASKATPRTTEWKARIAAAHIGKKLSPEHAEKARLASVGRKQSREEIEKRRKANTGKKRTPEFCERMREIAMRPDIVAARTVRMNMTLLRPDIAEANRIRTIERNKSRTGKKYPRKTSVIKEGI